MTDNVVMNCTHYWAVDDIAVSRGQPCVKTCLKCGDKAPYVAPEHTPAALFDALPEIDDDALNAARALLRAGACDVRALPWNLLAGLVRRLDETLKRGLERDEQLKAQEDECVDLRGNLRVMDLRLVEMERINAELRARDEARGSEPASEGTSVDHEEAAQLAHLRKHRSNLARCYLDLKATLDAIYKPSP